MRLTVIGIGQSLRGDDAAGVEAVRRWQATYPATACRKDVKVTLSELPGLALLDQLEGFDAAVIVDAVQSSAEPGVIHRLTPVDLEAFGAGSGSAHGWGIAETLKLDRQLNPERDSTQIRLIGIEARQMQMGHPLSPAVEKVMPQVCQAIQEAVEAAFVT
jgi:hydrogenase maturation protease